MNLSDCFFEYTVFLARLKSLRVFALGNNLHSNDINFKVRLCQRSRDVFTNLI